MIQARCLCRFERQQCEPPRLFVKASTSMSADDQGRRKIGFESIERARLMSCLGAVAGTVIASLPGLQSTDSHVRALAFSLFVVAFAVSSRESGMGYGVKARLALIVCLIWNAAWALALR